MSAAEIFQLEHDFVTRWEEQEAPTEFYVANGFAHPKLPVITAEGNFSYYSWGLIPSWVKDWNLAKDLRVQTLNAIGDTLDKKPAYRSAVSSGRFCVIPVNGFFEWHHHANKQKYPHFIYPAQSSVFLLAGLYEHWTDAAIQEEHHTFTIVTTEANERMSWIHNSKKRMPAILSKEAAQLWLDKTLPFSEKKKLIQALAAEEMCDHSIGKRITSRKENPNVPEVLEKEIYPELNATQ
jgi:putative SOS response-associated peptidase YedK